MKIEVQMAFAFVEEGVKAYQDALWHLCTVKFTQLEAATFSNLVTRTANKKTSNSTQQLSYEGANPHPKTSLSQQKHTIPVHQQPLS